MSQAEKNYLKAIFALQSEFGKGVQDSSDIFLDYLNQKNIHLGCTIKIESKESFVPLIKKNSAQKL